MKLSQLAFPFAHLCLYSLIFSHPFLATGSIEQKTETNAWPVMVRGNYNPALKINFEVKDEPAPIQLGKIQIDLTGTTFPADIASLDVYLNEILPAPEKGKPKHKLTKIATVAVNNQQVELNCPATLSNGKSSLIFSPILKDSADIDGKLTIAVSSIEINGKTTSISNAKATQRIGYTIAKRDDLGSKNYRIPGIATSAKTGTMISVYDIRYNSAKDLPARIDVGFSRSTNNGKSWTPTQVMMTTHQVPGFEEFGNGLGDPAILCDDKTGYFWVAALTSAKKGHPLWSFKGTTSPRDCGQFVLSVSKDDGKTWSKIINITPEVKRLQDADTAEWACLFQGPGNGICMQEGTLVFPAQIWGHECKGPHHGVLVYSKDNGKTWKSSKAMTFGGSESTVVETQPGTLLLNTREGAGWFRMVGETKDLGETWQKHISMEKNETKLRQPGGCQGSILGINYEKKRILYFSNPDAGSRKNMTLKLSENGAESWPKKLLYDERPCAGYSSLAPAGKDHVGILYEGNPSSEVINFIRIPHKEMLASPNSTPEQK